MKLTFDINQIIKEKDFSHYSQDIVRMYDWTVIGKEILLHSAIGNPEYILNEAKKEKNYLN